MSPFAGSLLLSAVIPLITAGIRRGAKPVGTEDYNELVQDASAVAAAMIDSAERREAPIIPKSIAYYAVQTIKSGRRSTSAGRTDVMSAVVRMGKDRNLVSMDLPVDEDDEGESSFGDMLACNADDPGMIAGRNLDWDDAVIGLDRRGKDMIMRMCEGVSGRDMAGKLRVSPARVCQIKRDIGRHICDAWDADASEILKQSAASPAWRMAMANAR